MKISVITPTGDRQPSIDRLSRMLEKQTVKPDEWVIGDDGFVPTIASATIVRGQRLKNPKESCVRNYERALKACTGDIIVFMEDDDWYSPRHIETAVEWLQNFELVAQRGICIYALNLRAWKEGPANEHGGYGFTSMKRSFVERALHSIPGPEIFEWDKRMWLEMPKEPLRSMPVTCVSLRGIPQEHHGLRTHITFKHKKWWLGWNPDPNWQILRQWLGEDADEYIRWFPS